MEIKPGKSGFLRTYAEVRFDSLEELYFFGAAAPPLSAERFRWLNYTTRGIYPGKRYPESFPATLKMPESTVARAAGSMMLWGGGLKHHDLNQSMVEEITNYFTQSSHAELERLADLGKKMVDGYEAGQSPDNAT